MSYGLGMNEDELREAMSIQAAKDTRAARRRDGVLGIEIAPEPKSPDRWVGSSSRGQKTRKGILAELSHGPRQSGDIVPYVDVNQHQIKIILRNMMKEGLVKRHYEIRKGNRVAVWSLETIDEPETAR